MKESAAGQQRSNNSNGRRSAVEKEKTKMRERQRRAITTKIFNGLRKHGGYRLSPRSDINQVLRHLASEAGWIVDPDGTTYRSSSSSTNNNSCPHCGVGGKSNAATPTSSTVGHTSGGGGECSTTASPLRATANCGDTKTTYSRTPATNLFDSGFSLSGAVSTSALLSSTSSDTLFSIYMSGACGGAGVGGISGVYHPSSAASATVRHQEQPSYLLQEVRASNQNTPVGSPL
ncbi:uncharacterized protein LOC107827834 isoform X1 [Nicotiana tabacum]|uniref:Protein BZR1 homolog n=3 Tax=Nicotiana tabacum TaxID=4097 RepID=A0A1S4DAZ8_TOBAC|nr:PREDICTED: beta-amylase 7-like isoform X1 [Nicotiana tabacum]XP_016510539.1 PREDICTED: beta-amylase 7-like isoform X1 [Nicotiana tabacum]